MLLFNLYLKIHYKTYSNNLSYFHYLFISDDCKKAITAVVLEMPLLWRPYKPY